jgi:diguanylate cyclase (GGDEF)-like protein/PAS domain S-box-containing protein
MTFQNSRFIVATGFVLVLALMIATTSTGLTRMASINGKMDAIANVHDAKTGILTSMQHIVSARSLSMYALYLMDDPFERDAEFMHFNELASRFIEQRLRLEQMGLTPEEQAHLDHALALIRRSAPVQENIVARILDQNLDLVRSDMLHQDLPLEKSIWTQFDRLVALERDATKQALSEADDAYRKTYVWMLLLGLATIVLGAGITRGVMSRTSSIEAALAREKEQAEVTLHAIGDGVITTDASGRVTYVNPVAEQLTGWTSGEALGRSLEEIYHPVHAATGDSIDRRVGQDEPPRVGLQLVDDPLLVNKAGKEFAIEDSISPIRNGAGDAIGTVLVFRDVTRTRNLAEQLTWQASHDALTGLVNRRQFEILLKEMLENARIRDICHAVLYVDLDQFKIVNDTCGHVAGDELLKQLATLLQAPIRDSDTLARLGGDEFGVLLDGCTPAKASSIATELLETIQDFHFVWDNKTFRLGASIGVVSVDRNSGSMASVLSAADAACYIAKDKGRNRVWIHESQDSEMVQRRGEMEQISRITAAFEEERFMLYKQMIKPIAAESDEGRYYELLIRMADEEGSVTPPMTFLPAAERYGIMPNIDRWVIRRAFRGLADPVKAFEAADRFAINLSAQTLIDDRFLDFVVDQFAETGVDPARICFEITETTAIANWVRATHFISVLKSMGCQFALDDFGSGMSSFGYLKNLSVDFIKIDGLFVKDMVRDPFDGVMVEAIHHIARVMGIRTIAEFVEDDAILARLRELDVDYAQGYGIHVPEMF